MTTTVSAAECDRIRAAFPALESGIAFLENAGGSQVPRQVAEHMRQYLLESYVQIGAGYALSQQCTALVDEAHQFVQLLMNGRAGQVILGSSTSALLAMLASCYASLLKAGDEIVIAESGHEANLGPWKRLERHGAKLRWWRVDPQSGSSPLENLEPLINERTALVTFPHVSNLVGEIVDVQAVTDLAHRVGAKVVVDGVAYAPHRAIDCSGWNVDWYAFSLYKVYGPHMAALYGRKDAVAELTGPNHFFVSNDEVPYKFELGGVNHEGCAGILGMAEYLRELARPGETGALTRVDIEMAFVLMTACEYPLQEKLLAYLGEKPGVRVVGPAEPGPDRVGTISFVHESLRSQEISAAVDPSGVAIRHGHMYAYHLCEALGLDPEDGVVRTSFVHYNTVEEIERLIEVFEGVLD
ncbi:MAG: aminotransferase class V-fold PLP-dependent enzyme [bacterium]